MGKLTTYEYGAMSSKYSCKAENKLTAYVTMGMHFNSSNHLIAIYSPEECKKDMWLSFDGKVSDKLDDVFGGPGKMDEYIENNVEAIRACYNTIKQLV